MLTQMSVHALELTTLHSEVSTLQGAVSELSSTKARFAALLAEQVTWAAVRERLESEVASLRSAAAAQEADHGNQVRTMKDMYDMALGKARADFQKQYVPCVWCCCVL